MINKALHTCLKFTYLLLCAPIALGQAANEAPLFLNTDVLDITLSGPFRTIDRERDKDSEYEGGILTYLDNGQEISLDVKFEVRGNFRLRNDVCNYAQLWIDFDKDEVADTIFADQNRMKLVVQCGNQTRYERYVVKEHQIYQMYNTLTDLSFRSRLVNVTYHDTDRDRMRTHKGVFIEHKDGVAQRNNFENNELNSIDRSQLDALQGTLTSLFMYMIGNTDFSLVTAPEDECCHNAKLFLTPGTEYFYPAPYDFDSTGYVNASYAETADSLRLRSVRQRLFRGFCAPDEIMNAAVSQFKNNQESILAIAANTEHVDERTAEDSVEYLEQFFSIINDPEEFKENILDDCRG